MNLGRARRGTRASTRHERQDATRTARPTQSDRQAATPAARPTRSERQQATRAALLRSASRLVCEHGMQGASIDRIAAHAGFTKGAFYANFASKEDLFLAMLDERFAAELERLQSAMVGRDEPEEEARHASEDFVAYLNSDPQWPRLYQEFAAHAARNPAFRERFAERQRALRARMADLYERWAAAFEVEPVVPHADVAAMTFFMADGFLLDRTIDPKLDDALYTTMLQVFLRGLMQMAAERDERERDAVGDHGAAIAPADSVANGPSEPQNSPS